VAAPVSAHAGSSAPAGQLFPIFRTEHRFAQVETMDGAGDGRPLATRLFEHRIRTTQEYHEKAHYIRQNPVRKGLVTKTEEWAFVWEMHA
ncbi:MAG TPA: hypothetical protein PK388_04340, partial [Kiritimatiellia bacterium]|nr:hypothetical protein [Kiritimatiellia bacterium]